MFFFLGLPLVIHSQRSSVDVQVGTIIGYSNIQGGKDFTELTFIGNIHNPSLYFSLSYKIQNNLYVKGGAYLQSFSYKYSINSIDLLNRPVVINYSYLSTNSPVFINLELPINRTYSNIGIGLFTSFLIDQKLRIQNIKDFTVPFFTPAYSDFKLKKTNYGIMLSLNQSMYSWELSNVDLNLRYEIGLRNMNFNNDSNEVYTRYLGLSLLWNINLTRR